MSHDRDSCGNPEHGAACLCGASPVGPLKFAWRQTIARKKTSHVFEEAGVRSVCGLIPLERSKPLEPTDMAESGRPFGTLCDVCEEVAREGGKKYRPRERRYRRRSAP